MDILWQELTTGFSDTRHLAQVVIRLLAATVLGALVGFERQRAGKPAGLRTHTLVCLGTTVFILACSSAYMTLEALSRVIQGIVTGIGFIGAGSILKLSQERDIRGLTTAAGVWMTSAIGVSVGLGSLGVAVLSTVLALIILRVVGAIEARAEHRLAKRKDNHDSNTNP
jgi:putative Mg2+ transporter-C (MgtC) family protein